MQLQGLLTSQFSLPCSHTENLLSSFLYLGTVSTAVTAVVSMYKVCTLDCCILHTEFHPVI